VQGVDLLVGGDHALGDGQIGVQQGRGGAAHGRTDQASHLDQGVVDGLEVDLELFAQAAAHLRTPLRDVHGSVRRYRVAAKPSQHAMN